ncbi:MAG: putative lipoprotein [Cellvibrio sp.]|nr:putative lipoprotein [Cellvibrio sp.]
MNLRSLSLLSAAGMLMSYTINVQAQCDVKYTIQSKWGSGATLDISITNLGAPKTTWELLWNFSNAEKISQLWNGSYIQTGQSVRVKHVGWNSMLNTNQTVNFGFNISYPNGMNLTRPADFFLDGVKCVGKTSSSVASSKYSSSLASSTRSSSSLPSSASSSVKSSSSTYPLSSSARSSSVSSSASSTPPLANCTDNLTYGPRLLRVLTRAEYINSVRDLTGVNLLTDLPATNLDLLLANTRVNGFDNNTQETITKFVQANFGKLAINVVDKATANLSSLLSCPGLTAEACATRFTTVTLTRIFRRPATEQEIEQYLSLFAGAVTSQQITAALGLALSTALSSPQFLYRQETGIAVSDIRAGNNAALLPVQPIDNDAYVLTPYELASFLAFTFTGSTPDDELLNAAKNNALQTESQIEMQVNRLLNKTSAREHFGKFSERWLGTENVSNGTTSAFFAPEFTAEVKQSLSREITEWFGHVALDEAGPFNTLLASNYGVINKVLFNFYGLGYTNIDGTSFVKTNYPAHIRQGGLLTSGAFVASKSDSSATKPSELALAIRNRVLCQDVYGPTTLDAGPIRDNSFWQVGFAYQNLYPGSQKRTQDSEGNPVNSVGILTGVSSAIDGATLAFSSAGDLAQKLSTLDASRYCFVEHNFRAAFGTGTKTFDPAKPGATNLSSAEQADYLCEKERLDYAMTSNGNNVRTMLKRLGSLQSARYRKDRSQ